MLSTTSLSVLRYVSLSVLVLLGAGVLGCESVQAAEPDPQVVVQAMLQVEQDAWNKNDSVAYAAVFSSDADFINIRGQIFTGRQAVADVHAKIFAGPFKGSTISIVLRGYQLLAPGVVMIDTEQTVTGYVGLPPGIVASSKDTLLTHFKYVAVKQVDGSWEFISGQNTAALPN